MATIMLNPEPVTVINALDEDLRALSMINPGVTLTDLLLVQLIREIKKLQVQPVSQAQPVVSQAQPVRRR